MIRKEPGDNLSIQIGITIPHTNTPKVWVSGWFGMQASETITATSTWSLRRPEVHLMVPNPKP